MLLHPAIYVLQLLKRTFATSILFLMFSMPAFAQFESETWRLKPQIGLWFGPVTPFPGSAIAETLKTNLGGGMFFRMNLPSNTWRTELGFSYSNYGSDGPESLDSVPAYLAVAYTIPVDLPLKFQAKLGGGANWVQNHPELKHNTHPALFAGTEISFPAGKWVNIGLRTDYYFVYEKHIDPPAENPNMKIINGHFLNFGLMVNFNLAR